MLEEGGGFTSREPVVRSDFLGGPLAYHFNQMHHPTLDFP